MLLESVDGASVGVNIVGYEFISAQDDDAANWLEIRLDINHAYGHGWRQTPCLTTKEVAALVTWLRALAQREPLDSGVGQFMLFREPNIQFKREAQSGESVTLGVTFNLEQPGEWTRSDQPDNHRTWSGNLRLHVPREDLARAADDLEQQALAYPPRHHPFHDR